MVPVAACSGTSSSTTATGACNGAFSTSTTNVGHNHTLCVSAVDLASPPAGGQTYISSANGSGPHTHTVTLSQTQLSQIQAGQSVTVTSTNSAGHTHDFAIMKAQV
jgi:hypothetical protein